MIRSNKRFFILVSLFALLAVGVTGIFAIERSEVENRYKWDLTPLYQNVDAFKSIKSDFAHDMEKLTAFQGKLGESPSTLKQALDLYYDLEKNLRRMETYTSQNSDLDTRVSESKALEAEVSTLRTQFAKIASYIEPEILTIDEKKLDEFFQKEAGLTVYRFPIHEIVRRKAHILDPEKEKILAAVNDLTGTPYNTYGILSDADMPLETIKLADGTDLEMTYPNYAKTRMSLVQEDRVKAFEAFFRQNKQFKRTMASLLYGQMKIHNFYANMRGYKNTLDAALDTDNIDPQIYHSLIKAAHENLPTFHRYLKLKARALGKDKLDYTDIYVPFTTNVEIEIPYDQAQKMLLEAFQPLGKDYVKVVDEAFNNRWIDVYPTEGKRSGAYATGWAYDVHPYVLMDFNDTFSDTLTLAHEMGHAMHSYNSNTHQPFPVSYYSTFTAEVASTFNENLLNDYMIKKVKNEDERLYLLGNFLDGTIKGTFFRQIHFAEFELKMHEAVERGEALTDVELDKLNLDLAREYYGHNEGYVNVPEYIGYEWSIVPHFYYNYYVFQYSTSVAAASLLSQRVLKKERGALQAYYGMLQAGGSTDPVAILKNAGADMTNPAAYQALMERANRYMDEVEKILDKRDALRR